MIQETLDKYIEPELVKMPKWKSRRIRLKQKIVIGNIGEIFKTIVLYNTNLYGHFRGMKTVMIEKKNTLVHKNKNPNLFLYKFNNSERVTVE